MKALSKGTVINICKGYPYNKDKTEYYHKLQEHSTATLQEQIKQVELEAKEAYQRGHYTAYGSHLQQYVTLVKTVESNGSNVYEFIKQMRQQYEQQAWQAFSDSNYSMFGYYADTWQSLTDILGDNMKNPWRIVAAKINAKGHSHSVKFSNIKGLNQLADMSVKSFQEISDTSWTLIKPTLPIQVKGRPAINARANLNGILFAFCNCRSLRAVPAEYGKHSRLSEVFTSWYVTGVFSDLLQLSDACPELDAVKPALLDIEIHKLVRGIDVAPRLCDIQKRSKTYEKKSSSDTETNGLS
jgi:transposase